MDLLRGPGYWSSTWGIEDFATFAERLEPYFGDKLPFPFNKSADLLLRDAYYFPLTPVGSVAAGLLAAQGAGVIDPATLHGVGRGLSQHAITEAEEHMVTLILPNVYRVAIQATSGTQPIVNVVGVRGSSSGLEVSAANAVKTAWEQATGPMNFLTTAYVMTGYYAVDLSSAFGGIASVASTGTGSNAQALSTNAACALVKWNGSTRSRSSRGRLYYGPLSETRINSDGRTLTSGDQATMQTRFTNFRTSLSGSGFTLCVISPATNAAYDVTSHVVESVIATQRRRIRA